MLKRTQGRLGYQQILCVRVTARVALPIRLARDGRPSWYGTVAVVLNQARTSRVLKRTQRRLDYQQILRVGVTALVVLSKGLVQ